MPHRLVSQYEKRGSSSGSAGSSKKKRKKKVVKEEASEVPPESTFLPGEIMPLDAEESEKDMAVVEEEEPEVVIFSGESHSGKKVCVDAFVIDYHMCSPICHFFSVLDAVPQAK